MEDTDMPIDIHRVYERLTTKAPVHQLAWRAESL